jgi:hypothetical protein
MKRILFAFSALLVFASCKKEAVTAGGLRVTFTPRHQYKYVSINVYVSSAYYNGILNQGSSTNVSRPVLLKPVMEGSWYWRCTVNYEISQGNVSNSDFEGTIVIRKGIIEDITVQD